MRRQHNSFYALLDSVTDNWVVFVFLCALTMTLIGANHFWEDTLSSRYGIEWIEQVFNVIPVSYNLTYWTMSLAPQVAQVVFFHLFLVTRQNKWLVAAAGCFMLDFGSDVWYRSNKAFFANPENAMASIFITVGYFTIGSEMFLTIGSGVVWKLFPRFVEQVFEMFMQLKQVSQNIQQQKLNIERKYVGMEKQASQIERDRETIHNQQRPNNKPPVVQHVPHNQQRQQPARPKPVPRGQSIPDPRREPTYTPVRMDEEEW